MPINAEAMGQLDSGARVISDAPTEYQNAWADGVEYNSPKLRQTYHASHGRSATAEGAINAAGLAQTAGSSPEAWNQQAHPELLDTMVSGDPTVTAVVDDNQ